MNLRIGLFGALAALCVLTAPTLSNALTLNFDEFGNPDTPGSGGAAGAPAGPIGFINTNHGLYDAYLPSILLGDDGWDSSISFNANDGFLFDAISLRFVGGFQNVYTAPISSAVIETSPYLQLLEAQQTGTLTRTVYPNVSFTGYRDNTVVATQMETYDGGTPTTASFSSGFVNLDKLKVEIDFGNALDLDATIVGNTLYYCPNEKCGVIKFDDLLLNLKPLSGGNPTLVSLPAPFLMLGSAVFGFGFLARKKRGNFPNSKIAP